MQNERTGFTSALYSEFHRIAWPATEIGFAGRNVTLQVLPIQANDAVAGAQPCALRGASFHHIFNRLRVSFRVIGWVVGFIEAELYPRARTHNVHPKKTVGDCNYSQHERQSS
jgi:hypothetical protein